MTSDCLVRARGLCKEYGRNRGWSAPWTASTSTSAGASGWP